MGKHKKLKPPSFNVQIYLNVGQKVICHDSLLVLQLLTTENKGVPKILNSSHLLDHTKCKLLCKIIKGY